MFCYLLLALISIGGGLLNLVFSHNLVSQVEVLIEADKALTFKLKQLFHMARLTRANLVDVSVDETEEIPANIIDGVRATNEMYREISQQLFEVIDNDNDESQVHEALILANQAMDKFYKDIRGTLESYNHSKDSAQLLKKQMFENSNLLVSRVQNLQEVILRHQEERNYFHTKEAVFQSQMEISSVLFLVFSYFFMGIIGFVIWRKQKKQDEVLSQQTAILVNSSKLSVLGEMAGGIAHEINNPLAVITMRSQQMKRLLSSEPPKVDQALDFAGIIESTAYRISYIVQGMRSFSRNADKDPFQTIDVGTIIRDTLSLCSEKIRNNGSDIQIDEHDPAIEIKCRPPQVCQVLLNLILNANDATSELAEKWIRISVQKKAEIEISVTDSGPGISEAVYEKMFQPFFTTKEIGKGTGLGLSISKGIIEEHGGNLRLDRASKNTRFIISLPCS